MRRWNRLPREALVALVAGGIQGRAGWDTGQPELLGGSLAHGRELNGL